MAIGTGGAETRFKERARPVGVLRFELGEPADRQQFLETAQVSARRGHAVSLSMAPDTATSESGEAGSHCPPPTSGLNPRFQQQAPHKGISDPV
jgi:hypothetical protein